jgi:hypothetical protein
MSADNQAETTRSVEYMQQNLFNLYKATKKYTYSRELSATERNVLATHGMSQNIVEVMLNDKSVEHTNTLSSVLNIATKSLNI